MPMAMEGAGALRLACA